MPLRLSLVVLVGLLGSLASAATAQAAFPGENGKIAFEDAVPHSMPFNPTDVFVMNPDGTGPTNLTNNPAFDGAPAWSADGTKIAFASNRDGNWEIYAMNADGTGQTRLTNNSAFDSFPGWSPDGTKIAFTSDRDGNREIYVMNADGTGQSNITGNTARDEHPSWSPDGTKIAFVSTRGATGDFDGNVYTAAPDGSGLTRLTDFIPNQFVSLPRKPDWAPDSQRLVFDATYCNADDDCWEDLFLIDADGTGLTTYGNFPNELVDAAWSPDGMRIVFYDAFIKQMLTIDPAGPSFAGNVTPLNGTAGPGTDWQAINGSYPAPPYQVPKSASPIKAALVPVFRQCGTGGNPPNSQHAPPLAVGSCNPPQPFSNVARVGASSISRASLGVMPSNPSTPANDADVALEASLTDIQTAGGADYNPNASGPDLTAYARVRLTDRRSCTPTPCSSSYAAAATTTDAFLAFPVNCVNTLDANVGATCNASTTANTLTPGFVVEGNATVVQSFRMLVDDSGANGVRGDSDDRIFMTQGVVAP